MEIKQYLRKVMIMAVIVMTFFTLTACKNESQVQEQDQVEEVVVKPSSTPVPLETPTTEPTQKASYNSTKEYISATDLFSLKVPDGWSSEEVIPGADFIMANSELALERYKNGYPVEQTDFALNVGFLPFALLKENQLKHFNFQFEASPEILLQSLLPMFRIGDQQASNIAGETKLVLLSDGREAGMLTLSDENREGMVLMFVAGDGILAFVSVETFPGEMVDFKELTYALAAEVVYNGSQDALYGALYGG